MWKRREDRDFSAASYMAQSAGSKQPSYHVKAGKNCHLPCHLQFWLKGNFTLTHWLLLQTMELTGSGALAGLKRKSALHCFSPLPHPYLRAPYPGEESQTLYLCSADTRIRIRIWNRHQHLKRSERSLQQPMSLLVFPEVEPCEPHCESGLVH